MRISNRFFESGVPKRLCAFEVLEGGEWAPPYGTEVIHVEPIISDSVVEGMYLWALVPGSQMEEVMGESDDSE